MLIPSCQQFTEYDPATDVETAIAFLTGHVWPYHSRSRLTSEEASRIKLGPTEDVRSFWVFDQGRRAGLVRLYDLADTDTGSVLFDLRLAADQRGRGLGRTVVAWLTNMLFTSYPKLHRIEATTRIDNHAMRRVLEHNHYALEGQLRETWLDDTGHRHDTALYGRLRRDGIPLE